MRNRKVTTGGVVLLVIAALIIVIGFSGVSMVRPTGLGHELYGQAVERQANIDALNDALQKIQENAAAMSAAASRYYDVEDVQAAVANALARYMTIKKGMKS